MRTKEKLVKINKKTKKPLDKIGKKHHNADVRCFRINRYQEEAWEIRRQHMTAVSKNGET